MGSPKDTSWIARFGAMRRLATAFAVGVVAYIVQPEWISWHTRIVVSWDLGTLMYLGLAWALIARADARVTRDHALSQDQSGFFIFLFVVGAACASIVAIGFVVGTIRDLPFWARTWHLALTVVALISSWLLIQTVFAFHYARRYYDRARHGESRNLPAPVSGQARTRLSGLCVLLVRDRHDLAGVRRCRDLAAHAAPHPDPRVPGIRLQYRGAGAQHQHHRQRELGCRGRRSEESCDRSCGGWHPGRDFAGGVPSTFREGSMAPPLSSAKLLIFGVADGIRTHDNRNHNPGACHFISAAYSEM